MKILLRYIAMLSMAALLSACIYVDQPVGKRLPIPQEMAGYWKVDMKMGKNGKNRRMQIRIEDETLVLRWDDDDKEGKAQLHEHAGQRYLALVNDGRSGGYMILHVAAANAASMKLEMMDATRVEALLKEMQLPAESRDRSLFRELKVSKAGLEALLAQHASVAFDKTETIDLTRLD
ncbi:hypothetical protein [Massilia sp. BJB1822]|uniref:hypothetical protein n=1 Tax=Massilia sp. BJB1822 TaxID=2744470 RepID=UPI001593CD1C|nr:hypothetical protein [Massilia sp. BJB1822]NVD98156.1 hypothetical protein [Massilia sp. BJB1822]